MHRNTDAILLRELSGVIVKLYIVNFRKCLSTVLSLGVNPILLIKMSAFTGDSIHIDQIYVHICMPTLYIKVLKGTLHFRNNLGSKDSLDPS